MRPAEKCKTIWWCAAVDKSHGAYKVLVKLCCLSFVPACFLHFLIVAFGQHVHQALRLASAASIAGWKQTGYYNYDASLWFAMLTGGVSTCIIVHNTCHARANSYVNAWSIRDAQSFDFRVWDLLRISKCAVWDSRSNSAPNFKLGICPSCTGQEKVSKH